MQPSNNESRQAGRRSTGSWDLDISLQILDASFADFHQNGAARGAAKKREPRARVTRYEVHGHSPATADSHGATWHTHPMPESVAQAYLAEKRSRGSSSQYSMKPVTVEQPIETSVVRWTPKHPTKGVREDGSIGPMSALAADYYMRNIPQARKDLFNFEVVRAPEEEAG